MFVLFFLIQGTSANGAHLQCYLLDGTARWNDDRQRQLRTPVPTEKHFKCYDYRTMKALDMASEQVTKKKHFENLLCPREYTGKTS